MAGEWPNEGLNACRMDPVACGFTSTTHIKTLRSLFLPEGRLLRDKWKQTPCNGHGVTGSGAKRSPHAAQCLKEGSRFRMEPQCLWTMPRPCPQTPAPKARGPAALWIKVRRTLPRSLLEPSACFSSKHVCWTLLSLQVAKPTSN